MGKVHRIKRAFAKLIQQEKPKVGPHDLRYTYVLVLSNVGDLRLSAGYKGGAYWPLVHHLIEEFESSRDSYKR